MTDKPESASRTALRIEAVVLQGLFATVLAAAWNAVIFPLRTVASYIDLLRDIPRSAPWWRSCIAAFTAFPIALGKSLFAPIAAIVDGAAVMCAVCRAEWRSRDAATSAVDADRPDYLKSVIEDYAPSLLHPDSDGE